MEFNMFRVCAFLRLIGVMFVFLVANVNAVDRIKNVYSVFIFPNDMNAKVACLNDTRFTDITWSKTVDSLESNSSSRRGCIASNMLVPNGVDIIISMEHKDKIGFSDAVSIKINDGVISCNNNNYKLITYKQFLPSGTILYFICCTAESFSVHDFFKDRLAESIICQNTQVFNDIRLYGKSDFVVQKDELRYPLYRVEFNGANNKVLREFDRNSIAIKTEEQINNQYHLVFR